MINGYRSQRLQLGYPCERRESSSIREVDCAGFSYRSFRCLLPIVPDSASRSSCLNFGHSM
jgi:hypothetical protein